MRAENYTFFDEYKGPDDRAVCGNGTGKSSKFLEAAKAAVAQAVADAPNNQNYARVHVKPTGGGQNDSTYVLANCWRTLNASSCRACLENASSSILGCLPSSEGRALNTGCFMRYSDTNFLNAIPGSGSSKGSYCSLVFA